MSETDHIGDRPSWNCRACGEPWPCPAARNGLAVEFARFPSVLRIYLAAQMYEASQHLDRATELYDRFLAWTN